MKRSRLSILFLFGLVMLVLSACSGKTDPEGGVGDGGTITDASPTAVPTGCKPGAIACRCTPTGRCEDGLRCESNVCRPCSKGSAGCACEDGGKCDTGLQCSEGICQGCVGKDKCPCHGNNSCDTGHRCVASNSSIGQCEACEGKDKTGCNCDKDDDCGGLACINNRCKSTRVLSEIPTNPVCYTPCEGDKRGADGSIRICHTTFKLMEGCEVGQTCQEGSCVAKDQPQTLSSAQYPFCLEAIDCPNWQTCIQGRCYSDCRADSDCQGGKVCHRYVCRRKCAVANPSCGSQETCETRGQDEGVCVPRSNRNGPNTPQRKLDGTYQIINPSLAFNNHATSQILYLRNKSEFPTSFVITRSSDSTGTNKPLSWLKFDLCQTYTEDGRDCKTFANKATAAEPFEIPSVQSNQLVIIKISNAGGIPKNISAYTGSLKITNKQMGEQPFFVSYRESGDGQWKGRYISFANFNDRNIFTAANKSKLVDNSVNPQELPNALLRQWMTFKKGMPLEQFRAILRSIQEGTWDLPQVRKDCKNKMSTQSSPDVVCYPYSTSLGYKVLSFSQREAPVPSGVSELNFAINVKEKGNNVLEGRIDSTQALQYPGNPRITLTFEKTPGADTFTQLTSLNAVVQLGGRFYVNDKNSCTGDQGFIKTATPWLIPGFTFGSFEVGKLFRESYECRASTLPKAVPADADDATRNKILDQNTSLSRANPIPNGWSIDRTLELVDGGLVQNRYMILLVRERFRSFFASNKAAANNELVNDFANYGLIFLERTPADLEPDDFTSSAAPTPKSCSKDADCGGGVCAKGSCKGANKLWRVACTPELVKEATGATINTAGELEDWSTVELDDLVSVLLLGQAKSLTSNENNLIKPDAQGDYKYSEGNITYYIHSYCEDTGLFNGGANGDTACPPGSKVVYFRMAGRSTADLQKDPCQAQKNCHSRLLSFSRSAGYSEKVPFMCADKNQVVCDDERADLRKGKIFFKPSAGKHVSPFNSLQSEMLDAFRYRLKFTSRSGTNIGFTPSLCKGSSDLVPYCYDPARIEKIERRVNCLQALYSNQTTQQKMSEQARGELRRFLEFNFSYTAAKTADGALITNFGFETLNAELKIMLGDEAFIQAFASRYDLAGTRLASFEGSAFEPNGISLSGALGFEMHSLYLSAQYYQMVLDRFFTQAGVIFQSFQSTTGRFITVDAVSSYFQKLLLASTRKARSWSQVAKRYHKLNRADLARHVIERAYVSTFMELQFMTRLLRELAMVTDAKKIDDIRQQIKIITLTYRSALLDMEEVYKKLTLEINFLGIPKGHIPFPALDVFSASTLSNNAFTVALQFAKEKMQIAAGKEQIALQNKRTFDTDAASFQSELVRIRQNYESQLLDICGGIKVGDKIYPATTTYAHLTPETLQMGNPCGRVEGGQLFNAYLALQKTQLGLKSLRIAQQNVFKQIELEKDRIQKVCAKKFELASFVLSKRDKAITLEKEMKVLQAVMDGIQRLGQDAVTIAELAKCSIIGGAAAGGDCPSAVGSIVGVIAAAAVREGSLAAVISQLTKKQSRFKTLEKEIEERQLKIECDKAGDKDVDGTPLKDGLARIESAIKLQELANQTLAFQVEGLKAELDIRSAMAEIVRLHQRAQRLITEQQENEQLAINVQAARNDPNIRIYKNDAIINAERTFEDALREAYRATLIYEYYTGTTYARKGDLFLIRMIAHGDKNLEAYVSQLEQDFRAFEEKNGKPDLRVMIVSLKNDILNIPRLDDASQPRSINARNAEFQQALASRDRLNNEGFFAFPFSMSVSRSDSRVSPITVNHKIVYIEAEIIGGDNGDEVARVYLRQKGTSIVRLPNNDQTFYTLPIRTAVINPFFNGSKVLDPNLYKNFRLRDRPLGNTHWELLFNNVSEKANQDIDLNKVNDIKLYIYYADFTEE